MWNNNIIFKIMEKKNLLFGIGGLIVGGIITNFFLKRKESNLEGNLPTMEKIIYDSKTGELGATHLLAKYGSVWKKKDGSGNIFSVSVKSFPNWREDVIEIRRVANTDSNSWFPQLTYIRLEDLLREYEPIK